MPRISMDKSWEAEYERLHSPTRESGLACKDQWNADQAERDRYHNLRNRPGFQMIDGLKGKASEV